MFTLSLKARSIKEIETRMQAMAREEEVEAEVAEADEAGETEVMENEREEEDTETEKKEEVTLTRTSKNMMKLETLRRTEMMETGGKRILMLKKKEKKLTEKGSTSLLERRITKTQEVTESLKKMILISQDRSLRRLQLLSSTVLLSLNLKNTASQRKQRFTRVR